jgi:hypothetical protein
VIPKIGDKFISIADNMRMRRKKGMVLTVTLLDKNGVFFLEDETGHRFGTFNIGPLATKYDIEYFYSQFGVVEDEEEVI